MGESKTVIFKYSVPRSSNQVLPVLLPEDAKILRVGFQDRGLRLWASHPLETPSKKESERKNCKAYVKLVATGEVFNSSQYKYLDTIFEGPYVWHIHVRIEKDEK